MKERFLLHEIAPACEAFESWTGQLQSKVELAPMLGPPCHLSLMQVKPSCLGMQVLAFATYIYDVKQQAQLHP